MNFEKKWDFEIVNSVKNETLKMWILWKITLWKSEFFGKWGFEIGIFMKNDALKLWFFGWIEDFCSSVNSNADFLAGTKTDEDGRKSISIPGTWVCGAVHGPLLEIIEH